MSDDSITLTLPRSSFSDLVAISNDLLDRMHELLERNTDGSLAAIEKAELETLVNMAQFSQLLSTAIQQSGKP